MNIANELYNIISIYLDGNKSRIKCLVGILIGLIKASTTNLAKVALNIPGQTKQQSKYRRLQRFFEQCTLTWTQVANFILSQITDSYKHMVILDRTNWQLGDTHINLLVLSIAWHGIAIPIYWCNLAKAGNSTTKERIKIIKNIVNTLGIDKIEVVLGDREFIGKDWLHWLDRNNIKFVVRIKNNSKIFHKGKWHQVSNCFQTLRISGTRILRSNLWGLELNIVGHKRSSGNLCIIVTNDDPGQALPRYKKRWQIESMFGCLKTRGFNLEATHLVAQNKIEVLFGLLAILTCWNCKIGYWRNKINPIKIKKHDRPMYNLFHYGMQVFSAIFNNIYDYTQDFKKLLKILKIPCLINKRYPIVRMQCV